MSVLTSGAFAPFLFPLLKDVYGTSYAEIPTLYDKFLDVEDSDKAFEDVIELTPFGQVPTKSEGGALALDTAYQGNRQRYIHQSFALGFEVTRELMMDDMTREIAKLPQTLAFSVSQTIETLAASILNNAFSSSFTGPDGKALCATDHPILGGTLANKPSNAVDLTLTGVQQMQIDLSNFKDSRGNRIHVTPELIVCNPYNFSAVKRIVDSSDDPTTASRSVNPYAGVARPLLNNFTTSNKPWWAITDIPQGGLRWFFRERPQFYKANVDDRFVERFSVYFRASYGFDNFRAIWGSAGQ